MWMKVNRNVWEKISGVWYIAIVFIADFLESESS